MPPQIRFATTSDGVRIAYATHGEGPALVFARGWISHLELHWSDPAYRRYFDALASRFRLVRYDVRGNGLSDRQPVELGLEALERDLEAVIDALDVDSVVLYGATYGGLIAIAYAAHHPERVSQLILDGTYTRGEELAPPERREWILSMLRDAPDLAVQRVLGFITHPDPEDVGFRRVPARELINPAAAVALYELAFSVDVTDMLALIQAPALVMHRTRSGAVPFRLGRHLAASLHNARFVPLEGSAHNSWEGDAPSAIAAIADFLGVEMAIAAASVRAPAGAPVTILFTDIESSTAMRRRLGDAGAQEVVRTHNTVVRDALEAFGGREIKHTGDGIMASFTSASRSIECAIAIQREVARRKKAQADLPLGVYIGLNAGEPIAEEDDLFGTSVDLARRICDHAKPGQILAANVVRELAAGRDFDFAGSEDATLRGFDEPVRLYEVRWQE